MRRADPAPKQSPGSVCGRLYQAGTVLGIRVLDPIILGDTDCFPFADSGCLQD